MDTLVKTTLTGVLLAVLVGPVGAVTVGTTTKIGPFVGFEATLHEDNQSPDIAALGTDLGWSYVHDGNLQFLFGDTWGSIDWFFGTGIFISDEHDDIYGTVDLTEWDDPATFSSSNIPTILLGQVASSTQAKGMDPGHYMDEGKTPIGGFSNGSQEYGIFYLERPVGCLTDAACDDLLTDLTCDQDAGWWGEAAPWDEEGIMLLCMDSDWFCNDNTKLNGFGWPISGTGFCVDEDSTAWTSSDSGRLASTAIKIRVAIRNSSSPEDYDGDHVDWLTNRFQNAAYNTVQDFVPGDGPYNPATSNQDYNIAGSSGSNRRVLIWGRPGFVGVNANGRNMGLYFAYVDMPTGSTLNWTVHYFTGVSSGIPQFSTDEEDAVPVDLSSTTSGKPSSWEDYDLVGQQSIVWVDHLDKWIMFYGGGVSTTTSILFPTCGVLELFAGAECDDVELANQAVLMRTADDPWGPWSAPQEVLVGGDPGASPLAGQYAAGGILYHPSCSGGSCQDYSPGSATNDPGALYGVNIIQPWIKTVGDDVDLIWNVSTWNPYQVFLMRTRIEAD